jgi:dihydroorotate dehydrogenase
MTAFYRHCLRPLLFTQDSEEIHNRTLEALGPVSRQGLLLEALNSFFAAPEIPVDACGLRFPNPVGLAAGMDKRGVALPAWPALGFGFVELGGVTWHAQPGNPSPRMFRAVSDRALINRMGFNNDGAYALAARLAQWRAEDRWPAVPVGINLGKSKITPLEQAADDYAQSFELLWPHADFFVVNVSSPNTPNLRQLQDRVALDEILARIQAINAAKPHAKPVFVKVAPDLSFDALDEILALVGPRQLAGIVATNTTITRPGAGDEAVCRTYAETGGLSGKPLAVRSTEVIRHLHRQTRGRVPIIGVGGIFTADDAWEKITAGACLVQVYTGLVYEGPGIVAEIVTGLAQRLRESGATNLKDVIGSA